MKDKDLVHPSFPEEDLMFLIMDYLENKRKYQSLITLQEETGLDNHWLCGPSEDILFLRNLIYNGKWKEVEIYINELQDVINFDYISTLIIIKKTYYIELLHYENKTVKGNLIDDLLFPLLSELKNLMSLNDFNILINQTMEGFYFNNNTNNENIVINDKYKRRFECFQFISNQLKERNHPSARRYKEMEKLGLKRRIEESIQYQTQAFISINKSNILNKNQSDFKFDICSDKITGELKNALNIYPIIMDLRKVKLNNENDNQIQTNGITDINCININNISVNDLDIESLKELKINKQINEIPPPPPGSVLQNNIKPFMNNTNMNLKLNNGLNDIPYEEVLRKTYENLCIDDLDNFSVHARIKEISTVRAASFNKNGTNIAIGTSSKALRICNVQSSFNDLSLHKKESKMIQNPSILPVMLLPVIQERHKHHAGAIYSIAWNESSTLIATGSNDMSIKVIKLKENDILDELHIKKAHQGPVRDVCFSSSNSSCHLFSVDTNVCIWDLHQFSSTNLNTKKDEDIVPIKKLTGHTGDIFEIKIISEGNQMITGSNDKTIRYWDIRTGQCKHIMSKNEQPVLSISCHPINENLVLSGHLDGTIFLWDLRTFTTIHSLNYHKNECRTINWSPDGKWILSGSFDGTICISGSTNNKDHSIVTFKHPVDIVEASSDQIDNKILQAKWHPFYPGFMTTGSDKIVNLWRI